MALKKEDKISLAIFKEVKAARSNPFEDSVDKNYEFWAGVVVEVMKFIKSENIKKKALSICSVRKRFWRDFTVYKTMMIKNDESTGVEPDVEKQPFFDIMPHLLEKEKDALAINSKKDKKKDQGKALTNDFKRKSLEGMTMSGSAAGNPSSIGSSSPTTKLMTNSNTNDESANDSEIIQSNDIPSEADTSINEESQDQKTTKRKRDIISDITESKNAIELKKIDLEKQKSTIEEKRIEMEAKKSQMEHEEKMKKMDIEEKQMQQQQDMTKMMTELLALLKKDSKK